MNEAINSDVILSWLQNRIAEELNCGPDEVDLEATFDLLGLDSVSLLWIAGELAEWVSFKPRRCRGQRRRPGPSRCGCGGDSRVSN